MPKIRERDQTDQIKSTKRPGKAPNPQTQRIMTAKLKKELVQRKRSGYDHGQTARDAHASNKAVEQTEQAAGISIQEIGTQIKRGVSNAVPKVKEAARQLKQRQELPEKLTGTMKEVPEPSKPKINPKARPAEITERPQAARQEKRLPSMREQREQQASDAQRKPLQQFNFHEWTFAPDTHPAVSENPSSKSPSVYPSIKERPRRSFSLKEKPSAGAISPKTRQRTERTAQERTLPAKPSAVACRQSSITPSRRKARREAQKSMATQSKRTAKTTGTIAKKAAGAAAKAVQSMVGALSALVGGGVLICALCVLFLVAAVIASPFGILFSNEPSPGAVPLSVAVSQVNQDFADKLVQLQAGDYNDIIIQGEPPDWREVAAVFACRTVGSDGVDVAALTPERVARLEAVFWDMCGISSETEIIDHPASEGGDSWTEVILRITITPKTADEMQMVYAFDPDQNSALTQLLEPGMLDGLLGSLQISDGDAAELLQNLPSDLSPERRAVVETACQLVGKVRYFWGGKSLTLGWDSRWGTPQKVTAAGSATTGTYRPFGLDCSGFVDWVFYNASDGAYFPGHGGGAAAQHRVCAPVYWEDARPGDLVFYPDDSHVGIVGGWDADGNIQIIHCASGPNGVVITGKEGFTAAGRLEWSE